MEVFRTRSLKDEGHGIKMRRLRKADTDADNIPEKKKSQFILLLGDPKEATSNQISHAIDVGFQFLQVD